MPDYQLPSASFIWFVFQIVVALFILVGLALGVIHKFKKWIGVERNYLD